MMTLLKTLSVVLLSVLTFTTTLAQPSVGKIGEKVVIFKFVPGDDMFYIPWGGNYAEYNVYGYLIGGILSNDTGYQGTLWSAGATVGYQLYLSRSFSLDFNLGLGYVKSSYDSFNIMDGVRVYDRKDQSKSTFGLTQAGVSLVWTIGGIK